MDKFDPNMRGVLFKNDKGDNPKRPDYRGSIAVASRPCGRVSHE